MKEKIIEILKSHSYHHTEGVGVKSQFKYLAEIAFELCADEIILALDRSQFTADEAEDHINLEVERRIKERMPSEMEFTQMVAGHIPWAIKPMRRSKTQFVNPFTSGNAFEQVISILSENLYKELRSRLTDSQKTEGGEG